MTECQLSDAPARRSCLSPFSLLCREPEKREQLRSQLTRDLQSDLGVYSYRTRLFCYSLFLFACELLALGGALSRSAQPQENSALTAQLSILLVLLCTTVPLFVTAYYCQHYWVRVATQATSFVLSACGFILMDGHFLGRETDSSKWETTINGLVPVAFLTSLLPPVLMYSWFVYFLVVAFALFVTLALRVAGSEWEVGTLEAGMAVLWLFAFCPLLYKMELSIKTNYLSSASTISEERFAPPKRGRTVTFATCDEVIGTELEDILEKLDKLQTVLQDAVVPDKQWAEETLSEVMSKLAMGRSIYQPFLHSKAGDIDPENLKFVEQNYMQTRVDPTIVKMGSVADSRSATQVELSTSYGVTELLPLLQKLGKDWNFDIFFVSHCTDNHALQTCGEFTMKKFNFPELLETGETVFRSFFDALAANYKPNPYHNAEHAADVLASLLFLYSQSRLMHCMKDVELLASVIAALGHDVGHPAVTNRFLITSRDPLAIIYNDMSVLEMMHCSVTFRVITETSLLVQLPMESWDLVRKVVVEMILATDMSKHFDMIGVFRAASINTIEMSTFEERLLMFRLAVKCADVGHAAKEVALHQRWSEKIVEEFFSQGDLEKESNLPVSMYCDRDNTDVSKSQIGFITVIAKPLFEVMSVCLGSERIEEDCVRQLELNIEYWRQKTFKRSSSLADHSPPEPAQTGTTDFEESKPLCLIQRSKTLSDCKRVA